MLTGGTSSDSKLIAFDTDGANKIEIMNASNIDVRNGFVVSNDSTKLFIPMTNINPSEEILQNLFEVKLTAN
jgi:hypothetical protein